jgi:hypothetical protein
MRQTLALPLALVVALAAPISAAAALTAHGTHHQYRAIHHRSVVASAEAPPPAVILAPVARIPSALELEGLSRNPDDCAKYGCVGNN